MNRFHQKVVLVTNADTDIGAATARRFLSEGASVVLNGSREKVSTTTRGTDWRRILWHEGDASNEAYLKRLVAATLEKFGSLHVLVNNVRPIVSGMFLTNTTEQWHRVIDAELHGTFFAVRSALPYLMQTGGSVVNVALAFENGSNSGGSVYRAARGALVRLSRSVAFELASEGVRLNVVSPRATSTTSATDIEEENALGHKPHRIPVGRSAVPEEVAAAIAFLASDDATFVNGVDLAVDGGFARSDW